MPLQGPRNSNLMLLLFAMAACGCSGDEPAGQMANTESVSIDLVEPNSPFEMKLGERLVCKARVSTSPGGVRVRTVYAEFRKGEGLGGQHLGRMKKIADNIYDCQFDTKSPPSAGDYTFRVICPVYAKLPTENGVAAKRERIIYSSEEIPVKVTGG